MGKSSVLFAAFTVSLILQTGCTTIKPDMCVGKTCSKALSSQTVPKGQKFYSWHDGSKGGLYGIGEGWSIDVLPAEFETLTETWNIGGKGHFASVPYYEPTVHGWERDESVVCPHKPKTVEKLVSIPATYKTIVEARLITPARTEYELIPPTFHLDKTLKTQGWVERRNIKAVTEPVKRRIVVTPEYTVVKLVPVECRDNYRRVVISEGYMWERDETRSEVRTRQSIKYPVSFIIKNPDGDIAFTFDDYDTFKTFMGTLK